MSLALHTIPLHMFRPPFLFILTTLCRIFKPRGWFAGERIQSTYYCGSALFVLHSATSPKPLAFALPQGLPLGFHGILIEHSYALYRWVSYVAWLTCLTGFSPPVWLRSDRLGLLFPDGTLRLDVFISAHGYACDCWVSRSAWLALPSWFS